MKKRSRREAIIRNALESVDHTERKRAEEGQRTSEALYRDLFEHSPSGIVVANPESYYIDANPAMCRMFGYTREEMIGMHASEIMVAAAMPWTAALMRERKSMLDYPGEWQFRRKDGAIFPVEVIASTMPDGNLMGLIRDITERKEAETALRKSHESLEHKVAERTGELRAALIRAEAADQLKSAFLANMSHELRTPLNSIIGFTGIILQGMAGPLNAEQTKQLGIVQTSGRHLLELINDVLDLSKIEAGQLEIGAEAFRLRESLERVTALVKPLADEKGLVMSTVAPPGACEMVSDQRRVEQIMLNLLNNAIKFTERGGVTLTAEMDAKIGTPPIAAVRLRVADTGIGIKTEDMATLFQPFRQIDTGLARQHEGTGLGLAICRRLATLLGGEIVARSEWQKGSEFSVMLPMGRAASTPNEIHHPDHRG